MPGYALGEYMSARAANGNVYLLWGDCRNSVTEPFNPFVPFLSNLTHSQEDVFFQIVKRRDDAARTRKDAAEERQ